MALTYLFLFSLVFFANGNNVKREMQQGGCSVCELVVQYVEAYLANNQTEQQIEQELDQLCALLGPLSQTCTQFVGTYLPQLIQWIENGENPQQFCTQVGLCAFHQKRAVQQAGCSVCELIVTYVESYIANNQTEQQIIANLDQLCAMLGPLASQCEAIVQQYVPQMIQWIINGENPQTFCTQVGLCSALPSYQPKLEKRVSLQAGCSICTLVVTYVETYIANNQTEQQIIANLDELCSMLGPLASQCDAFVAAYVPQVIQWIINGENPQQFCTQVGLCASRRHPRDHKVDKHD